MLLYMLRPNTGSTRRGAETVEWQRRPRVGGALQYLLRSGDAVAKEVKQRRRARPLPTDSRLQAFERQCLIRKQAHAQLSDSEADWDHGCVLFRWVGGGVSVCERVFVVCV